MKKIHKLVIKSFIGPLIITLMVVIFVMVMQFLWKYIDDLIGKGFEWTVISELLFYNAVSTIPLALPLAILLSSLMTFGNLGENYELLALKSSGISLQRVFMPLIILNFLICIGAFFFSNYVLPTTNLKSISLLYDVRKQRPELNIKEGIFYNGIDGYSMKVAEKDYKTDLLKSLLIYDHSDKQGNTKVTVADSGYMRMTQDTTHLILTLFSGYNYVDNISKKTKRNKSYPFRRDKFDE